MTIISGVCIVGVEDGQTVRMPVNGQEIFITFKVGNRSPVVCVC